MRVLYIAEIVGKSGIHSVKTALGPLKKEREIDFVIANADGATGGYGLGRNHSAYLRKLGVDVITGGEQFFYKKDMAENIEKAFFLLRPANLPSEMPGRGWRYYSVGKDGPRIVVLSLLGQSGFGRIHAANPYAYLESTIERLHKESATVILDFHAATTAEKYTMFFFADGQVSAIMGSGQRVPTADLQVTPHGTAFICDAGRSGSTESVAGFAPAVEIKRIMSGVPIRSEEFWARERFNAVLLDIDEATGKTRTAERIEIACDAPASSGANDDVPDDGGEAENAG